MTSSSKPDPFSSYMISSHEPLVGLKRSKCKKCGKSRMFFCYICHSYVDSVDVSKLPTVELPWKVDIIKHAKEVDGKSTAIHAALLAPDYVKIYTYPTIPDYSDKSKVLLVFPGKTASTMEDIFSKSSADFKTGNKRPAGEDTEVDTNAKKTKTENMENVNDNFNANGNSNPELNGNKESSSQNDIKHQIHNTFNSYNKIVFIDCTWSQAYSIFTDERLSNLPTVKLGDHQTVYWRHNQGMPFTYLATIEAIYSFFKISHELVNGSYDGQYDNLLYFFAYFHKMVHQGNSRKIGAKTNWRK